MNYHCFFIGLLCNMSGCLRYSKIMLSNSGYLSWWNAEKTTSTKSLGHFDALTEFCKYQLYVNLLEQNWPASALSRTRAAAFIHKKIHPNSATSAVEGRCFCLQIQHSGWGYQMLFFTDFFSFFFSFFSIVSSGLYPCKMLLLCI